jgi:hypothetical protein
VGLEEEEKGVEKKWCLANLNQLFAELVGPILFRRPFRDEDIVSFATYGCHQSQIAGILRPSSMRSAPTAAALFTAAICK